MSELRLTIGLPASGKSQYALKLMDNPQWFRINWDNMRRDRGTHLRAFNRTEEEAMQKDSFRIAEIYGQDGFNVIVDNTNLNENTRNRWKGVAQRAGMEYTEITMDTSLEKCIARDERRTGPDQCGRAVIERMALFNGFIKFRPEERLVLVDMDGTLADCSHRKEHILGGRHDWNAFEGELILKDPPVFPIINLVKMLNAQGYVILVVSGRQIDRAGKHTVVWLKKYGVPYQHIFMRNGGDNRPDNIIKQEILNKLPKNQITYVIDDRDQVVKMWRENGLTCLQVADGNF